MLLDGHKIAHEIQKEIQELLTQATSRPPCLAAILTTKNPGSLTYVSRKVKACHAVGIHSHVFHLEPKNTRELVSFIHKLNEDTSIDGILIQLPLPPHIDLLEILQAVDPKKDVDGFHPLNVGKALMQDPTAFYPCTPLGIQVLLERSNIPIVGQHVVIVGRSNIVGKPLATLLLQNRKNCNATVTVLHSHSKDIPSITRLADILVVAIGHPHYIQADMVREGATVVDVGINRIADTSKERGYRIVGDVDFTAVKPKCRAITPVPGGVGPMTIAMLLQNTVKSFLIHHAHTKT